MPEQTITQITFRGQTIDATVFWVGERQYLMAAVPDNLTTTNQPSEQQEVVVLNEVADDRRVKSPNIETMASFRDRLFGTT